MYILPAIDILDGKAVRLAKGDYTRVTVYNDNPVDQAKIFEQQGATWIHVVDLNGAKSGRQENIALVGQMAKQTDLRIEHGGGIRDMAAIQRLFDLGVSRVVLGSALVIDKAFTQQAIAKFGDVLCAGVDARGGEVAIQGWREGVGVPAEELVAEVARAGFSHLVYTDIARDGMQCGVDAATYERIAGVFGHPVIASGGVTDMSDLRRLRALPSCVEGVITGRAVYEQTLNLTRALEFCKELSC